MEIAVFRAHKIIAKTSVLILLFVLMGFENMLMAQGGRAGAFLRVGVGARAKSMGDAYSALSRGLEASYYNPAGLPFLAHKEVIVSYRLLSLDRQFTYIGFGMPIRPKVKGDGEKAFNGGFSLAWIRAGVDDIDGRDTDGRHFDDLSNSENAFIFSFGLNPVKRLSLGLSVKIIWNRFPDIGIAGETVSATGAGFDFGVLFSPIDWLSLGVAVKEINSKYRWNTEDIFGEDGSETINEFPKIARYAVAFKLPRVPDLTLAFDYEQLYRDKLLETKIDDRFHLGAEGVFKQTFVVRVGFDDGSLTAGGGYEFGLLGKMSQLNYSFTSPGDRPEEEHVFTWVFQF